MKTENGQYKKDSFSGTVLKFGVPICNNWEAETFALTKNKAMSNLKYRFKKENNLASFANVELVGTITAH